MKRRIAVILAAVFVLALLSACGPPRVSIEVSTAAILKARAESLFHETVLIIATVWHDKRPFNELEIDRLKSIRDEAISLAQRAEAAASTDDSASTLIEALRLILGGLLQ